MKSFSHAIPSWAPFYAHKVLLDWINDELSEQRIVLRDITEDLYDGQILAVLMGMLPA